MQRTTSPPLLPRSAWRICETCGRKREYWRIVEDDAGGVFCSTSCQLAANGHTPRKKWTPIVRPSGVHRSRARTSSTRRR